MNKAVGMRLFLCGDVMTGRGIDQILPQAVAPQLHEAFAQSALDYVHLAEQCHGPLPRSVDVAYIWGDALIDLQRLRPDARIINLETAITLSDDWQPKGINYRMHPANVACLRAAQIDICVLANNHVLDWGQAGLWETLSTLQQAGIKTTGAGPRAALAAAPAILPVAEKGRVLVFSAAHASSGVPASWCATENAGINWLPDLGEHTLAVLTAQIAHWRQPDDIVVFSLHWGGNWGYAVPPAQQQFARALIDRADVDVVHGHSSHHPKAIEVYRDKLILYGCGDFINDYEGIGGHEGYRADLCLAYFPILGRDGKLQSMIMRPYAMRSFSLRRASRADADWLRARLSQEGREFHTHLTRHADNSLQLHWQPGHA